MSASEEAISIPQPPDELLTGDDLAKVRKLNCYESCTLQIGDKRYVTVDAADIVMTKDQWRDVEKDSYYNSKVSLTPTHLKNRANPT